MQYQCNMQEEPGDCHQPHNPARTGSEPTENTTGESKVNLPVFPVYHFLVSAAILVFVVIFWRTHHRDHRNWLALRLFVLCSVNRWPLRMVKGTIGANKSRVFNSAILRSPSAAKDYLQDFLAHDGRDLQTTFYWCHATQSRLL